MGLNYKPGPCGLQTGICGFSVSTGGPGASGCETSFQALPQRCLCRGALTLQVSHGAAELHVAE